MNLKQAQKSTFFTLHVTKTILLRYFCFFILMGVGLEAESSRCRRLYDCLLPKNYQQMIVTQASRIASTIAGNGEYLHILIPHLVGAGLSFEEIMQHDAPHPLIAKVLTLTASALPGLIAQGALTRQTRGEQISLRNLTTSVGIGICSGVLVREGAHLFFIVFPNSWVSGLSFIGVSLTIAPTITTWAYNVVSSQARRIWHWCRNTQERPPFQPIGPNAPITVLVQQGPRVKQE